MISSTMMRRIRRWHLYLGVAGMAWRVAGGRTVAALLLLFPL